MLDNQIIEKLNLIRGELKVVEKQIKDEFYKVFLEYAESNRKYPDGISFEYQNGLVEVIGINLPNFSYNIRDGSDLEYKCQVVRTLGQETWYNRVGQFHILTEQTISNLKNS